MKLCKIKLKKQRDDGDIGLNSNSIIYGLDKLLVFLSLLFRFMSIHGQNSKEVVTLSSIIIINPKIPRALCLILIIIKVSFYSAR